MLTPPPGCTITALPSFVIKALPSSELNHARLCAQCPNRAACVKPTSQRTKPPTVHYSPPSKHSPAAPQSCSSSERPPSNPALPSKAQGSVHVYARGPPATTSRRKVIHPPGRPLGDTGAQQPRKTTEQKDTHQAAQHTKNIDTAGRAASGTSRQHSCVLPMSLCCL